MVITYTPKPGQYSKLEAFRTYRRPMLVSLCVMMAFLLVDGFLMGLMIAGLVQGSGLVWMLLVIGSVVVFIILMLLIKRQADRLMDKAARRRLALLRGGQAEAFVSMMLRDDLEDDWHLFDNLKLDATSDIDHVVVGPGGLFVISTKSHRGFFRCDTTNGPVHNGEPTDWVYDATRQAMRLKDQLAVVEQGAQPWIQTVLAVPFSYVRCDEQDAGRPCAGVGKVWVLNEDSLLDAVNPERVRRKLNKREVERWAGALKKLHERHGGTAADVVALKV